MYIYKYTNIAFANRHLKVIVKWHLKVKSKSYAKKKMSKSDIRKGIFKSYSQIYTKLMCKRDFQKQHTKVIQSIYFGPSWYTQMCFPSWHIYFMVNISCMVFEKQPLQNLNK